MTHKLYLDDQYLQDFSSTVARTLDAAQRPAAILEQTLFYPASGGQPHDTGFLNDIPVLNIIVKLFDNRDPGELKILTGKILKNFPGTIILFGARSDGRASLLFMRSEEIDYDMGKLMQDACTIINGRGGGRPQLAQGGGPGSEKLDMALKSSYESIRTILTNSEY